MSANRRIFDITERIIYLRSIPVAAALPPAVLHVLAGYMRERSFAVGHELLREGDPIESLILFTEGGVRLTRQGKAVGELVAPQTLGFLGILARGDSPYDARIEKETRALELRADALLEVMEDHFDFFAASIRYVAERLLQEVQELPEAALNLPFQDEPMPLEEELDLVERIFFLRKIGAFSNANVNALAVVANQVVERRFGPGELLWRAGDPSVHSLMIVSGTVACASAGRTKRFRYGPGTIVGGVEGLAGQPHWYDVVTETPVLALEAHSDKLLDLFEENYAMAMDFMAALAGYLQHIINQKLAQGVTGVVAVPRDVSSLGAVPVGA